MNTPTVTIESARSDSDHAINGARSAQQEPVIRPRWRSLGRAGIGTWLIVSAMALMAPESVHAWSTGGHRGSSIYGYSYHRPGHSSHRYRRPRSYRHHSGSRSCSRVSKTVRIDGRLREVTGSRCYDRHGNPYIKRGSRRLGGYYSD
ncbi:MAG: hypothetical protein K9L82_19750 [Chromatiaceae bacterium]|nr:hypothetical protein [Chromatiaceae bacterium]MCF7996218.1 hypothetical protein [Chromatiaceae bacterium]